MSSTERGILLVKETDIGVRNSMSVYIENVAELTVDF